MKMKMLVLPAIVALVMALSMIVGVSTATAGAWGSGAWGSGAECGSYSFQECDPHGLPFCGPNASFELPPWLCYHGWYYYVP